MYTLFILDPDPIKDVRIIHNQNLSILRTFVKSGLRQCKWFIMNGSHVVEQDDRLQIEVRP